MKKQQEIKFQKVSQREHVLLRSGMYVGSINTELTDMYCVDNTKTFSVIKKQVRYNAAFLKIFDEVISNASDAAIKYQNVSYIKVNVDRETNTITVENDCTPEKCIPVVLQEEEKCYVPEMIFSHLLTGSNYDDTETRFSAGVNGMGVKLTNIFSTKCSVQVADGKKIFKQEYSDNMSVISKAKVSDSNKCFVKFSYTPDFSRFNGLDQITDDDISLILKRMLDISVCIPNVKMYFNNEKIGVKNFKEWMSKHLNDDSNLYIDDSNPNWIYGVAKSPSDDFNAVSVTSTVSTYRGGTHINYLSLNVSKAIADSFSKKIKANWVDVKNKLMLFVVCRIPNPMFDSQTKEYLTNTINKECLGDFKISESFIKKVMKSDIVESILAAIERKENDELKKLQKQQQKIKIDKLIDATSTDRTNTQLFIFEGDSAGESSRNFRDSKKQGIFKLKGKFMNISKMSDKQILVDKNGSPTEAAKLMSALGLTLNGKVKKQDLRYDEILIATDMDTDGDSITGLLLNFFAKWEELFELGMIYRVMTPLLVIKKGKNTKYFYTNEEWLEYQSKNSLSGYSIEYKKGLGSLEDEEYQEMIQNPRKIKFTLDENSKTLLDAWFGDDVDKRKKLL